jgi:cohesin domain-containing protein
MGRNNSRHLRVWSLAAALAVALALAYVAGSWRGSPAEPASNAVPAPTASDLPRTNASPVTERAIARAPFARADGSASTATVPALPVREAPDTGRAQPVFVSLAAPSTLRVGDRFTALVNVETENDVSRIALTVQYDPRRVRAVSARAGEFMAQAHAAARFSYAQDAAAGRLSIQLDEDPGGPPVSGGNSIAAIEFLASASGTARLSVVDATMFDLNNERVPFALPSPQRMLIKE